MRRHLVRSRVLEPTGPREAKIRVANFYLNANGTPGAALDFYDTGHPSNNDKPLISGLAYGQISRYVSPREEGPPSEFTGADYGQLYIFPHGCKTFGGSVDGMQSGTNITNVGWVKGQQETLVLGDDDGLQPQPSSQAVEEVEPAHYGQSEIIKATSGKGVLVVNTFGLISNTGKYPGVSLRIDGSCVDDVLVGGQSPSNGTIPALVSGYAAANFPLALGTHTLNIVSDPAPGAGILQKPCDNAPAQSTTVVKVTSRPTVIVFYYGSDPHHVRVLVSTIG